MALPPIRPLESQQSTRSIAKSVTIAEGENELLEELAGGEEKEATYDIFMRLRQNCLDFVFPPYQKVMPKPLARVTSYARYGPAVLSKSIDGKDRLRLRGAAKGTGVLREHEETVLIKEEEAAVVTDIYTTATPSKANAASLRPPKTTAASTIDGVTFGDMNAKKHPLIHHLMEVSVEELTQVLDQIVLPAKEKNGATTLQESTIADCLSNALLGERQRRINVVKTSTPELKKLRTDAEVTNRSATRFYNKTSPKAYELRSWEDPKNVLRALHRSAWQIAEPGCSAGDLSFNVRCLRDPFEIPAGSCKEGWDPYCCMRKTASGKASTLRR